MLLPCLNYYPDSCRRGLHFNGAAIALPSAGSQLGSDICYALWRNAPKDYRSGELIANASCGQHNAEVPAGHPTSDRIPFPQSARCDISGL